MSTFDLICWLEAEILIKQWRREVDEQIIAIILEKQKLEKTNEHN